MIMINEARQKCNYATEIQYTVYSQRKQNNKGYI